jgi:assimilatory nitrate reductase catalytic subunit
MAEVKTTCPYCGVGCGVIVADGKVRGDPEHPANFGRLCSKGTALAETLDDSDRLLRPRVDGRDAGWDEALDLVAARFAETIAEYGPGSVAFYASGQFLTEDYYVANKLMKGFIGSGNMDTNSRLCMASTVAGHIRAFGADVVPGVYEDWEETDIAVLVGGNTAWCHPVLFQRLKETRARRGTRVIVIDPRRTATCEIADLHLQLAPGSDVALFDGLLVFLADNGHLDRTWIDAHSAGFEAALAAATESAGTIAQVARITGLAEADILAFYERFAATERAMTVFSQGVNQSSSGTDKVNAIINCHLATGRIGKPGMGPFSVTGQPNAMGGREVGGLANQLAAHMRFDEPADIDRVGRFWRSRGMAQGPGLKAVDLFDAVLDGRVKAIWIMATNPADSMPNAGLVRRALEACPLVVVSDAWETDTTDLAHVVLPAASWGEKDGTVTNSERRISRQRAFREAPGEARPDWWIMTQVARRMGWDAGFPYQCPADIFREHAALSAFENEGRRAFDIGALAGLSDADYEDLAPARWPVRAGAPGERLFGDGRFQTPDGRARFIATPFKPPAAAPGRYHPFVLNTGRVRDQWHTMTRTGLTPRLMAHQDEPFLDLSPADARRLGIEAGDLVRIRTQHGASVMRARPAEGQRPGELFASMHWTDRFGSAGPVDRLTGSARDPISGQPELKATPASLAPVPTLWRGILAGGSGPKATDEFYHVRIPTAGGDSWELRGWSRLPAGPELADWSEALLGDTVGTDRITQIEPGHGLYRFALVRNGRLRSYLAVSTNPRRQLPPRSEAAEWLGQEFGDACRQALFAEIGIEEAAPQRPRTVCACFSVNAAAIETAIRQGRLASACEVGKALKAGTNCGSCIPEIEEILRDVRVPA